MIIEVSLFIAIILVGAGDCYSTAKLLRFNHKMIVDEKFRKKIRYKMTKKLKEDESKAEMSAFGRKIIQKYGADRAMLYGFLLGYGPLSIFLLYIMLLDSSTNVPGAIFILGFMVGVLWRQIMKAVTFEKQFGVKI